MDLTSGFYNLPIHEEDKKYTIFTTSLGLHEYNQMLQGLCNSQASFMRVILSIFGNLNFSRLLCYLDDLLVFAPSKQKSLDRLEFVFQRLREHNLKLSSKKCHLFWQSVKFLGHIIDGDGVTVDQEKVEVITKTSKRFDGGWWLHTFSSESEVILGGGILLPTFHTQLLFYSQTSFCSHSWPKTWKKGWKAKTESWCSQEAQAHWLDCWLWLCFSQPKGETPELCSPHTPRLLQTFYPVHWCLPWQPQGSFVSSARRWNQGMPNCVC